MGVDSAISELIAEIDQITRLFHQLRDVPPEVRDLFNLLGNSRQLLSLAIVQLTKILIPLLPNGDVSSGAAFRRFRSRILDLEIFLNPDGRLHHSGPQSYIRHAVPWPDVDINYVHEFCQSFEPMIQRLDVDSQSLLSMLASNADAPMGQVFSFGSTEQPTMQQPRLQSAAPASIASTARSSPLPSYLKAEEQEIMARFIDQYFPPAAGAKRKRAGHEQAKNPTQPFGALSPLIQSLPFPPGGLSGSPCVPTAMNQVPSAPSNLDPTWQFNGFQTALPSFQPPPEAQLEPPPRPQPLTARGKGKQRAARIEDVVGDLSSSSSGSIRSLPLSSREGSVYSANSQRRVFQTGSTRLWHTQGRSIKSFTIEHIEIRRNDRVSGEGIAVVCRTESGQDVVDDLWMASSGMNSTPFIENSDIANEYQRREKSAKFVVSFAPNPKHHPQYSFSTKEDCWDFVQAITDKILLASIDVESIKSACTHGNSVETSCQTVQIWDDSMFSLRTVRFFRNKNENAQPRIVELNVNEFRCPDDGKRSGKLTVWLRDALEGPGKDLKYLKIVFSSGDQEEEFLQLVGFGIPNMSL